MELGDRFDHLVRLTAHDGATTFRARDTAHGSPVLLRTLDAAFPSPEEVVRLERELSIGRDLQLPGLLAPQELVATGGKPASVLPDPGLEPLSARLERGPLPLADALRMGRHLARALAALHDADLVHTGLCPATVLLSAHGEDARIFDVRSATRVPRTQQTVVSAELLRGSLPHLAPEQTGRMNRAVDYRSDLYALGTVLYHALAGHPPFQGRTAMALVHAHIAQAPAPLDEVDASVPGTVAALVGQLLAKNAEDRYQSALGVAHDLDRCLQALEATGSVAPFPLGEQDHGRTLRVSERLYGRDAEVARLMAAFTAAADGERRLLLVSGYSGVGKSVLVHEVHRPIVERRGYFLSGKFEQLAQAEPLDGLRQALRQLVGQVLTESEAQLETWRQRLLPALESDGGVVTQLLPEVSHIVGDQPPVMELGPAEGRRRFDAVLVRFIQAFAGPGHPLVLFLDDLQWVDAASLRVLSALLHSEASRNLLVICSYRDNEVDAAHPFLLATEAWKQAGVHVDRIELAPLAGIDLRALVADSLEMSHADVAPLADVMQQKTGGNPFFVNQYLRSLVDDGLIALGPGDAGWTWNIDAIRLRQVTGGVVDLMVQRTAHYPEETRHLLELASVLGNTFALDTLALVGEVTPNAVARALDQPVLDGHVIPIGFAHDYYRWSEEGAERAPPAPGSYKFAHDRVQEAARSRIAAADVEAIHLRIGRLLMADLGDPAQDERLFDVVNNLNKARARLDAAERDRLVDLDLVAARRAKTATAYATALEYAQAGLDLLGPGGWDTDYARTFAFVRKRIELEFLSGNMARAAEVFAHASTRVRGSRDIGDIYQLMIRISHTNNDIAEGMRLGRECLSAHFSIDLPTESKAAGAAQAADMARIKELLGGRPLAELVSSPVVTDPRVEVAQGLLHETWTCAVMAGDGQMVTLTALALVRSSLEHGHSKFSACGYVAQAMVSALTGQYAQAGEYGRLAMDLCHRFEDVFIIPKVHNTYANFTNHMVNHVRTNIPIYEESYRCCHQSGDRWWGSWAVGFVRLGKLVAGLPLPEVLETQQRFHGYIESSGYVPLTYMSVTDRQIARNLMGLTPERLSMDEPGFEEAAHLADLTRMGFLYGVYHVKLFKAFRYYLYGEMPGALALIREAESTRDFIPGTMFYPDWFLYSALIEAAAQSPGQVQAEALARIDAAVKQMEVWAGVCPDGFAHRLLLMKAERARLLGGDAAAFYEGAVEAARKGNFLHHEALACELTGRFYASLGRENPARGFIEAARYAYQRWGAKAKVAQLAELHPWLEDEGGSEPVGAGGLQALDLDAVVQAGAAMTGEIVLDRLLQKMLAILVENAGAERGALFLDQDGSLRLHALGTAQRVEVIDAVPLDDCADLPRSVIRYAARTRETVLLHDAAASSLFRGDPLVRGSPGTSMLCVPLVRQGRMLGELYLENRRVAGAFTARRVEVLRLLSTVAATALENAVLYNTLEQKVASRTSALRLKNEELARTLSQLEAAHTQLVQSEKMAALGQLVAGIAHEINTPLGAIHASTGNIEAAVDHVLGEFPGLLGELSPQEREVLLRLVGRARGAAAPSSREARQIRRALEERLEELEIPDAGDVADTLVDIGVQGEVGDLAPLLTSPRRDQMLAAAYNLTGLAKNTRTIDAALGRASKVVFALKTFAHKDHAGQKTLASVVEGLENVLTIYGSYLRQGVEVHRQFEPLPQLLCLPDELQQVWINLIHNALQAMQFKGQLWLTAKKRDGEIVVSVRDDGPGIPPEIKHRIFDAFFTTKPAGEGSGLGLHICSQIVARHGGTITATSEPGSTTIEVVLPVQGGPQ